MGSSGLCGKSLCFLIKFRIRHPDGKLQAVDSEIVGRQFDRSLLAIYRFLDTVSKRSCLGAVFRYRKLIVCKVNPLVDQRVPYIFLVIVVLIFGIAARICVGSRISYQPGRVVKAVILCQLLLRLIITRELFKVISGKFTCIEIKRVCVVVRSIKYRMVISSVTAIASLVSVEDTGRLMEYRLCPDPSLGSGFLRCRIHLVNRRYNRGFLIVCNPLRLILINGKRNTHQDIITSLIITAPCAFNTRIIFMECGLSGIAVTEDLHAAVVGR